MKHKTKKLFKFLIKYYLLKPHLFRMLITQCFVHNRIGLKEIHWFSELTRASLSWTNCWDSFSELVIWKFFEFSNRASFKEMYNYFLKYRLLQQLSLSKTKKLFESVAAVRQLWDPPSHPTFPNSFSRRVPCSHTAKFGSPFQSLGQRLNQFKHSNSSLEWVFTAREISQLRVFWRCQIYKWRLLSVHACIL